MALADEGGLHVWRNERRWRRRGGAGGGRSGAGPAGAEEAGKCERADSGGFREHCDVDGDWNSGTNNGLPDVIAPDAKATARVIANFRQVVKEGSLKLHPIIARLVDAETLKKMGTERMRRAGEAPSPGSGTAG
jgi:hypothetical protein